MLRLLLVLVCMSIWFPARTQDAGVRDSLQAELDARPTGDTMRLKVLAKLWRLHKYNDLETAARYGRQMVREAANFPDPKWTAAAYQSLASTLDYQGKSDSALVYFRSALATYLSMEDTRLTGVTAFNIASLYYYADNRQDSTGYYLSIADSCFTVAELPRQRSAVYAMRAGIARFGGRRDEGLAFALRGLELAQESQDSSAIIDALYEVAMTYEVIGNYPAAIEHFEAIFDFDLRTENYYNAATDLLTLSAFCIDARELDRALEYSQRAASIVAERQLDALVPNAQYNLGKIYEKMGNLETALGHFQVAERTGADQQNSDEYFWTLHQLGATYLKLGRAELGRPFLVRALRSAEERDNLQQRSSAYEQLAAVAKKLNRSGEEADYLRQAFTLKDSLFQRQAAEKLAELTATFEREKQELTIQKQAAQLESLKSRERADRLQKSLLWAGLIAALLLFGVVAFALRQRLIRQRAEKDRLSAEVKAQGRQLSAHALQMAQKGRLLDQLGEELRQIKGERPDDRKKLHGLIRELGSEERIDQDWDNFRTYFQVVHGDFEERLRALADTPLSPREWRLAALIRMQLNNQEVGAILGVSQDSLYKAKYRLRKKLSAASGGELDAYLLAV